MIPPKNSFCFAPKFNHPNQGDATGAFHPYMEAFEKLYSKNGTVATLKFDNHATAKSEFNALMTDIQHAVMVARSQLDALVYFGHGWPTGMVSADIYNNAIPTFADLIRKNCAHSVKVILYACLCGAKNAPGGSFAARLANELTDVQAEVYAHDNAGHTTTNPNVYRFFGIRPAVLVAPPAKFHAFDKLLKTESIDKKPRGNNAFWARYPFMTDAEIDAEVSAY
jgi:hypothetical protein